MAIVARSYLVSSKQFAYIIEAMAKYQINKSRLASFNVFIIALLKEFPWMDIDIIAPALDGDIINDDGAIMKIKITTKFNDETNKILRFAVDLFRSSFNQKITAKSAILIIIYSYLLYGENSDLNA